jgi:hypothetical protein
MAGLPKATVLIFGLLLAAAAVVGIALAWRGQPTESSGQTSLGTPTSWEPRTAAPTGAPASNGIKTATFALG